MTKQNTIPTCTKESRKTPLSPLQYLFQVIFKTSSRLFRDIFETMSFASHSHLVRISFASRSHRGRFRRVTVPFEHCFRVLTCKDNTLVLWFCDILPHSSFYIISFLNKSKNHLYVTNRADS